MEKKRVSSMVCPYCGVGCRFNAIVENGRITGMDYLPEHPVAHGRLCAKGNTAIGIPAHPDRLTHPLKKTESGWERISWNDALDLVVAWLLGVRQSRTADAVGFLASAKCANEEVYLFQKLARMFGTNSVDHCARLCHSPTVTALTHAFGSGAMTNPLSDLSDADCIFIVGSNLAENHAPALYWINAARERGAFVVVVDPRHTPTAWIADEFLPIRPGTDTALLNGMARLIIAEGLADTDFISERTWGYDLFERAVMEQTLGKTAVLTGIPEEKIVRVARAFAKAPKSVLIYCMGVTQHTTGSDNVAACANLAMLTGNVGKQGAGVMPLRGQNNVQGACDMGALPNYLPGYACVSDAESRKRLAQIWGTDRLPSAPGLTLTEMTRAASEGRIAAMWIMGENPAVSDPNAGEVRTALGNLEFLIVQDIFMTETAKIANLVLPAATWAEKSGTFTNTERRVQWQDAAVKTPGDAQTDLWIVNEIGKRLGLKLNGTDAVSVLSEINRAVPAYAGVTKDRAASLTGITWPCPDSGHPGTPVLHTEQFATADGKGHFIPVRYAHPAENADGKYPLILSTGRLSAHYNSGSLTMRTDVLKNHAPSACLDIHPDDAKKWNVGIGEFVYVVTRRGRFSATVNITDTIHRGVVFLPFHFPGVNDLTTDALDPASMIPQFKISPCRLEKGGRNA